MARVTAVSGLFDWTANPAHQIGDTYENIEGDKFVYVKAGAVALVAGNWIQAAAELTNHDQLTPVAAAIGDTAITVALGATAVTADQYAGGVLVIDTTPSLGEHYIIKSHPAGALSTSVVFTLDKRTPLRVALTTSSRVTLVPSQYRGVIQGPATTATGAPVGVALSAGTALYYGWLGKNGTFGTLIAGTPGVGLGVGCPSGVAGAVAVSSATIHAVGYMRVTGVDTKCLPVKWTL